MEKNQRKMGVVLSYVLVVLNALVGFMYVPILLHYMGKNEYGLYQTMGSLLATFVILDFGLPATVIRYYSRYKSLNDEEGMENILALCSRMLIILTLVLVAAGGILYFFLDGMYASSLTASELKSAKIIFIILLINILFTSPTQIFNAIIISYERFVFFRLSLIIQVILQPIVVILLMQKSPYAVTLVSVYTISNFLLVATRVYYCFAKIKIKIKMHYFDKELFKDIISYAFFIFLNVVIDQVFWRSNQIILSIVASTAAVATYSIAYQISYNYMTLSTAVSGVFLPRVTEMVTNNEPRENLSDLFIKAGRVQFLLLSCVLSGFILFGRQFINVWAGNGFDEAYLITLLLIVPFTVELIQNVGQVILQALNKFRFKVYVFLGVAVVNVALAVPLAQKYGGTGCAIATGVTFFIGNAFIMNYYYAKYIGLDIKRFWKEIFKIFVPAIGCMLLGFLLNYISLSNQIIDLGVKVVIYALIYVIAIWLFAMNNYEKDLVMGPVNKIKRRFARV